MRAIDTNIVVRLITQDDPAQATIAQSLLHDPFLILPTVVMEAVWVLTSSYRMPRADVSRHLRKLLGYPLAQLVSGDEMLWALDRFATGADFADMLHLAFAAEHDASAFITFDRTLLKGVDASPLPVETLS